jgi:hypothetical protein
MSWRERGAEAFERIASDDDSFWEMLDDLSPEDLRKILSTARVLTAAVFDRIPTRDLSTSSIKPEAQAIISRVVDDTKQARRTSSTGTGSAKKGT